jgi:hypothetical protein
VFVKGATLSLRRKQASRLAVVSAAIVLLATPADAKLPNAGGGNSKAACVAAHEAGQSLRTQKKLHAAHDRFVACAKTECPIVLRKECTEQMEQLAATAPTVALEAIDDKGMGDDQVKVSLDGAVITDRLTGAALPVEPGEHVFSFERASDHKVIEQRVLVVEGDKNKKIVADYQALLPKPPPVKDSTRTPSEEKRIPVLAYVAGGVAAIGLGSFVVFSLTGRGQESDLASGCSPHCSLNDVAPVKRDYLIGDVSLGVAIVAVAAAVVLALPALSSSQAHTTATAKLRRPFEPLVTF